MNRIKEILDERCVKQIWLSGQLGKSFNMMNIGTIGNTQFWNYFFRLLKHSY